MAAASIPEGDLDSGKPAYASLDLCLTPYSIIATSPTSGLVEFVDGSTPISQILANNNNSILQFFQSCAPQQGSKYNVRSDVISSYVRSCAGYCVITYILGVGDRHLDNILISKAGRVSKKSCFHLVNCQHVIQCKFSHLVSIFSNVS